MRWNERLAIGLCVMGIISTVIITLAGDPILANAVGYGFLLTALIPLLF